MSDKLNRLLDIVYEEGRGTDITGVEYDTLRVEIINDLEKVNACGNLINQVNELLIEKEQLKLNFNACCRANRALSGETVTLREEIKQLKKINIHLVNKCNELDLGHDESWIHYQDTKEKLNKIVLLVKNMVCDEEDLGNRVKEVLKPARVSGDLKKSFFAKKDNT